MPTAADYVALGGLTRRFRNIHTGETISRRQYDKLFRLGPRGISSYEELARRRASPLARTKEKVGRVVERIFRGESRKEALRTEGLSAETLRRYDDGRGVLIYDRRTRRTQVHAAGSVSFFDALGVAHNDVPFDHREIKTMSAYNNAMRSALNGRRSGSAALASFAGVTVTDIFGNTYSLLTDVDAYRSVAGNIEPDDFFKSGDIIVSAPAAGPAGEAA